MKPMISNDALRDAVAKELESDPEVSAKHITVSALDGAVTLRGHVLTYHEKHEAVRAAERVAAVRAVADEIEVAPASGHVRADDEIAEEVAHRRGECLQSPDSVGVQVRDGRVILHGQVDSASQRDAVETAARQLAGVRAVADLIEVKEQLHPTPADVERRVQEALSDVTDLSGDSVHVAMEGSVARLLGHVPSVEALQTALEAASKTPGVTAVRCELVVTIENGTAR